MNATKEKSADLSLHWHAAAPGSRASLAARRPLRGHAAPGPRSLVDCGPARRPPPTPRLGLRSPHSPPARLLLPTRRCLIRRLSLQALPLRYSTRHAIQHGSSEDDGRACLAMCASWARHFVSCYERLTLDVRELVVIIRIRVCLHLRRLLLRCSSHRRCLWCLQAHNKSISRCIHEPGRVFRVVWSGCTGGDCGQKNVCE